MESAVQSILGNGEKEFELDAWTKIQVKELVNAQNKMDSDAVVQKLLEISENASFDQSKPVTFTSQLLSAHEEKAAFKVIFEDRERFRAEIFEQLTKRAKKHLYSTKRQESDFIATRVSE